MSSPNICFGMVSTNRSTFITPIWINKIIYNNEKKTQQKSLPSYSKVHCQLWQIWIEKYPSHVAYKEYKTNPRKSIYLENYTNLKRHILYKIFKEVIYVKRLFWKDTEISLQQNWIINSPSSRRSSRHHRGTMTCTFFTTTNTSSYVQEILSFQTFATTLRKRNMYICIWRHGHLVVRVLCS